MEMILENPSLNRETDWLDEWTETLCVHNSFYIDCVATMSAGSLRVSGTFKPGMRDT